MTFSEMTGTEGQRWIRDTFALYFQPKRHIPIDKWIEEATFYLPSNTSEPGPYSIDRTPYQRDILRAFSPDHPAKTIIMVFASQTGKTTMENIVMDYYIEENPVPIGFAFSDDGNLKNYVKNKFDPMLAANPRIKALLRSEGKSSADSLSLKQFPGGFLKFLSGKSESSMRSDSICLMMADELDAMGITKGGDPRSLLEKRQQTFKETSKLGISSTPLNDGLITGYLRNSNHQKYYMKCPHCGEMMTYELDYLRWNSVGDGVVTEAWMECPHCNGRLINEDKLEMMRPENGARWIATNPDADPTEYGYWLPAFYAPVGWVSWKDIAKEYVNACMTSAGVNHEKMTTFYNTVLALPYKIGSTAAQDWRVLFEKAQQSQYMRKQVPEWVNIITTGADVQKNRIEVSVYGWGKLGKSIAIDHIVIPVGDNELEDPSSEAWMEYTMQTLDYRWERLDGLMLQSLANGIDSSYKPDLVYAYYRDLPKEHQKRCFPLKGRDNLGGFVSSTKYVKSEGLVGVRYLDVPVSSLKHHLFDHLRETTKEKSDPSIPFYMEYPSDYSQEYYQQLYSETYIKKGNRMQWEKIRDRNEILDCTVYNLAMYYHLGLGNLSSEDWEGLSMSQKQMLAAETMPVKKKQIRRTLSKGVKL